MTQKRITISIVLLILLCQTVYCQVSSINDFQSKMNSIYANIEEEKIPTGVLFNQGFQMIDNLNPLGGVRSDYLNYWAIYHNVQKCSFPNQDVDLLPPFDKLVDKTKFKDQLYKRIPLSYLYFEGNYLKGEEILNLIEDKEYNFMVSESSIFALSVMIPEIYNSNVTFYLESDLIFSNKIENLSHIEIDFGDGLGFQIVSALTDEISVNYKCTGEKSIVAKLITTTDTLIANTEIDVKSMEISTPTLTGVISDNKSSVAGGTYRCELGSDDILDKPILIVEGFDLTNSNSENKIWEKWDGFLEGLMNNGYDIFCLNFNDSRITMEDNSTVIKNMINKINEDKVGNFEGIIIGESMGGILSRMALKEMENDGIEHHFGLYISFDAPHKGANIPYGIQTGFRDALDVAIGDIVMPFLGIYNNIFDAIAVDNVLDESLGCVAAQQLLSRHISGSSPFTLTQNYLSNLGYPEKTRNIALINGSNIGTNLSFSLGDQIFNNQWYWTALLGYCHELTINTTKVNKTDQEVSIIRIISGFNPLSLLTGVPIPIIEWHTGKYTSDDKAYDNCPAGIIDLSDYNLDIDEFSFVPTASSIDLSDDIFNSAGGLHYFNSSTNTKDNLINNNLTPFDDIYSQNLNTGHTYVIAISTLINTLIEQEIMHEDMYIQNRIIDQDIDFEAANEIHIGNDVNPFNNKNINVGDVVFKSGSNSLLSAPSIVLKPGTKIEEGSDFRAFSDNTSKLNSEKKTITKQTPQIYGSKIVDNDSKYYVKNISKGIESISWTLFSENNNYKSGESEFIVPENIPGGQYTLEVEIEDNTSIISSSTKVLWINNPTSTEKAKIESPDITQSVNIKVFPNPTSKNLNVEVENSEELFFVQIFDLNGQVLYKNSFTGKGIIDLSDLKGYFLIKIVQNNETITRKILSL